MALKLGRLLGAAGWAGPAHIVQFRAVGIERLGEERAEEGTDSGEDKAVSAAAVRRRGEGSRTHDRHDGSCLFSAPSGARSPLFWGLTGVSDATY